MYGACMHIYSGGLGYKNTEASTCISSETFISVAPVDCTRTLCVVLLYIKDVFVNL